MSNRMLRGDEEIMELIWQNGQIIKKSHLYSDDQTAVEETVTASAPLYIQEEDSEMTSLLQSPLLDDSSFADFLYSPPCSAADPVVEIDTTTRCATVTSAAALPDEIAAEIGQPPPLRRIERCNEGELTHRLQNFVYGMQNCAAVNSAAAPVEEIDTTTSCAAVISAAMAVEIDKIDASTAEIRPAPAPSSSRLIIPQVKCAEGELTHRLHCAAVTSAVAPVEEIATSTAEIRPAPLSQWPIIPQLRSTEGELTHRLQNIEHFSSDEAILRNCTSNSGRHSVRPSTIVESNDTVIAAVPEYMAATAAATGGACALTLTSSTSGSGGSVSASAERQHPSWKAAAAAATEEEEDRKRKSRESDDNEGHSEDVEFESADAKKQVRSSTPAKKSRAAEVHNLSERKRRDRINEKMRALQELIPCCNKADKASMLDEAIEYLKSLQLQVQMMSTGCNMVPMMYPGIPQYMPTMGMNMGMGMSMEMGMNRPMVPYPPLIPGPAMQNAAVAAQMAPRYPLPAYHLPPFPAPDPSRILVANQLDPPRLDSLVGHNINQPRLPNFSDPYHQYFGLQQAQLMLPQNQGVEQPSGSNKPNSCIEGSAGNHQSG